MEDLDWQDLRFFLAVARAGGLGRAAQSSGASAPTLSRRMAVLERAVGVRLFIRSREGYQLTEAGQELMSRAEALEQAATAIDRWRKGTAERPVVRVSAGTWTTAFLARHLSRIWTPSDGWALDFVTAAARLDIGRRQADIGLRSRRPEEEWLAGRRTGAVHYGAYRAASAPDDQPLPFIGVTGEAAATPSQRWLAETNGETILLRGNDPRAMLDLVRAGAGRAILPCMIGDAEPDLVRVGEPIAELAQEQWLVSHHEDRHRAPIRETADRIAALMRASQPLFTGRMPIRPPAAPG